MKQVENDVLCTYSQQNTTHIFTFKQGSRAALTQWASLIENLQVSHKWYNTGHLSLLLDATSAIDLPIRPMFEILSDYNRSYPNLVAPRLKIAFVQHPDTIILDIYNMFAELLDPPVTIQYFNQVSAAESWLQQQ